MLKNKCYSHASILDYCQRETVAGEKRIPARMCYDGQCGIYPVDIYPSCTYLIAIDTLMFYFFVDHDGHMANKKAKRKEIVLKMAAHIRALRAARGFSQESFALKANIDRSYYGGIERGEMNITVEKLDEIARMLKVKPSLLLE